MTPTRQAAAVCGPVWREVVLAGASGSPQPQYRHLPGVLPKDIVTTLPSLVTPDDDQVIALVHASGGESQFDWQSGTTVDAAYKSRPRTQVFEHIHERAAWPGLVALKLMELTGCRVVCRAFLSRPEDEKFDEHRDDWLGIIIPGHGVKRWWLRSSKDDAPNVVETRPGDLLLLPKGVYHHAATPSQPVRPEEDYSLHLQIAVLTHIPLS